MAYQVRNHGKEKRQNTAVQQLDAYISEHEESNDNAAISEISLRSQESILKSVKHLIRMIERVEIDKRQAFKNLKASNEAIRETILKLHDCEKIKKVTKRSEAENIECLDTDHLLEFDPNVVL